MIEPNTIERVKVTAGIVDVVGLYMKLKKDGSGYSGKCPFHNENTPSFKVSPEKNIYKCFGCGATGDPIEFVMKHEKVDFVTAVKKIAEYYKIPIEEVKETVKKYVKPTPQQAPQLSKGAVEYFLLRGIRMDVLMAAKVSSGVHWMPKAQKEIDVICFNYYRGNELINVKYRGVSEKDFMLHKDAELLFYNLNSMAGHDYVIITEGEIDCLSVMQSGYVPVISVPNGAAKGNMKMDYFSSAYDALMTAKKVILFTDNDTNGKLLCDELIRRIGAEKCFVANIPADCKDANDILQKHGIDGVKLAIKTANQVPVEGVFSMQDCYDDVKGFYSKGYPGGIKLGVPDLDEHISFMFGQYTTVTGIPGSGKSEIIDFAAVSLAKLHGWVFAICSPENQPVGIHVSKIMEKYVGKSFAPRYNDEDRISAIEFEQAAAFVDQHFIFIDIDAIEMTLDGILSKASELVARKGVNALVIDPWNYIEHKVGTGQTETQYISECLTKIKAFAKRKQIHIFLVAHPTKISKTNGKYDVPTLYSISGSAHFFNKTDNGITMYRDFSTNMVEVHIQKVRYSWLGKVGMVELGYDTNRRQYLYSKETEQKPPPNPSAGINPNRGYQSGAKQEIEDDPF